MLSPKLRQGFRRFRNQKRAYYSLIILLVIFLATLPAELICNSEPIAVRINGDWYFPVFADYTVADFGGKIQVKPDYKKAHFWRSIGCDPEDAGLRLTGGDADAQDNETDSEVREILELFDEQQNGPGSSSQQPDDILEMFHSNNSADVADTAAEPEKDLDERMSPDRKEHTDSPASGKASTITREVQAERDSLDREKNKWERSCWVLWPPVRYDYAYIPSDSLAGRIALAAPWGGELPRSGEKVKSSWVDGHYLGTDNRGRDVLARLIYGLRVSLIFGILLAITSTIVGAALGAFQGYYGGWADLIGQRLTEMWGSLPRLYLLMILSSLLARNIGVLFVILNLTSWMGMSAYMRAEFLKGRNLDYVTAARALGVSSPAIMFRHILPNSLTPIITFFPFSVTGGILALVSLDFLGLGVPSPYPSLGELLRQGQSNLQAVWIIVPTFFVLSGTITLLTFIGDGLRNAFDPRKAS